MGFLAGDTQAEEAAFWLPLSQPPVCLSTSKNVFSTVPGGGKDLSQFHKCKPPEE